MAKARIMIVEDEGLVALQIKEGLESAGYEVPAVASSGLEALRLVSDTEPDLILMDIHLSGDMDGIVVAQRIHATFDIPIIYLTAYSDEATVEKAKDTEPFGYILKPVSERPLQLAVEMTLQKARKEKTLKKSKDWYSSILAGMGQGIIVSDLKGIVKFINPTAENMTGWKQSEVSGQKLIDIFSIIDATTKQQAVLSLDEPIFEGNVTKHEHYLLLTKQKQELPIEFSIAPIKNRMNNTIGIVFIFFPATGQKQQTETDRTPIEPVQKDQSSLFPKKGSCIEDLSIDWFFRRGTSGSGDMFNIFRLDANHVGFFIADVTGYNFTSSIFSLNIHEFISPLSEKGGILILKGPNAGTPYIIPPVEVIKELNNRFYFESKDNPFFTIIYGIINTTTGRTRIVRAGHPFPLYQDTNGKISMIQSEGDAVGMFSDINVAEHEFEFEKGARLLLYSDSLIDSSFADINQNAFNRLIRFVEGNKGNPPGKLISALEKEEALWHENASMTDDAILFVIERT